MNEVLKPDRSAGERLKELASKWLHSKVTEMKTERQTFCVKKTDRGLC